MPRFVAFVFALVSTSLAACSGGGSSSPATTVQFQSATSSVNEGASATGLVVVLSTSQPALANAVAVNVSDLGSGNATSGLDFQPFAEHAIVFPAGSTDGATVAVDLAVLSDSRVEGAPETVRLGLSTPTGGAKLGQHKTHTLQIEDDDRATVEFESAASATPDESASAFPVAVMLSLAPGATLDAALTVRISDALTGTATRGSDYVTFPAQILTLPPSSLSGTVFPIALGVKADSLAEGAETVVLSLSQPGPGVELGMTTAHTITITDDDLGPGAELSVTENPDTSAIALTSGGMVDLGSQVLDAGATGGTVVRLASTGAGALALELPLVSGNAERDFGLEFVPTALSGLAAESASTASPLVQSGMRRAQVELDPAAYAVARSFGRARWTGVPLRGETVALDLVQRRSPWSADARIEIDGQTVDASELLGDLTFWSGSVEGEPESSVFLALSSEGTRGWVRREGRMLHLVSEREDPARIHVLDETEAAPSQALAPGEFCAEPLVPTGFDAPRGSQGPVESLSSGPWPVCRVALESDFQLYHRFDSAPLLVQYVSSLVAASSARYQIDVGTELEIAYLGVHSSIDDGWDTPDAAGSASQMLNEFQHRWGGAWGGTWPVSANLAHFLSGASLGGGVAYIGVLCDQNWGFAVSGNLNASIDWSSWSGAPSPLSWDFVVFSHELGHNFGAQHTHAYCPPLDRCYTSCVAGTQCQLGTLMSYCHLCGGMVNIDLRFHPFCANAMRSSVTTSCLGQVLLQPGEAIDCLLRFDPVTATGLRSAQVGFEHVAGNAPTPFELNLVGNALP